MARKAKWYQRTAEKTRVSAIWSTSADSVTRKIPANTLAEARGTSAALLPPAVTKGPSTALRSFSGALSIGQHKAGVEPDGVELVREGKRRSW